MAFIETCKDDWADYRAMKKALMEKSEPIQKFSTHMTVAVDVLDDNHEVVVEMTIGEVYDGEYDYSIKFRDHVYSPYKWNESYIFFKCMEYDPAGYEWLRLKMDNIPETYKPFSKLVREGPNN